MVKAERFNSDPLLPVISLSQNSEIAGFYLLSSLAFTPAIFLV